MLSARLKDLQRLVAQPLVVPAPQVVYADQQGVVHDVQPLQQLHVAPHLRKEHLALSRAQLQVHAAPQPVKVFERGARIVGQVALREIPPYGRALQVERLVDVAMRRKQVVHHHKVSFFAVGDLDPMQAVELRQERIGIVLNVPVVVMQNAPQHLMLAVVDRLDDVLVVA